MTREAEKKQRDNVKYCPECDITLGNNKLTKICKYCKSKDIVILSLGEGA